MDDDELLDEKAACAFIGGTRPIHPTTLYRGVKAGRFPRPIKVGPATNRWSKTELRDAIRRRAEEREHGHA